MMYIFAITAQYGLAIVVAKNQKQALRLVRRKEKCNNITPVFYNPNCELIGQASAPYNKRAKVIRLSYEQWCKPGINIV